MIDVLKCQILGEVEYAQHNFARLRPILYSVDGRNWTGAVERAWFPNAGLVFSLSADLRFAQPGSLWTFQVRPNERNSASDGGKDVYMTIQVKPATRFLTELEPLPSERLRVLATIDGFDPRSSTGGVLLPEAEDRWILAREFERGADDRARVTNNNALGHMRVLEGSVEEIAGCSTPDGRWVLPVINSGHGSDIRNWLPPGALAEQIAGDLRRWLPHAPYKARAAAAASALRELAPALDSTSAVSSSEVRAALDRVLTLTEDAESITGSLDQLVDALLASPAIAKAMETEKSAMREELETQALESAERFESAARERLTNEQAMMREALAREQACLEAMRAEIAAGEAIVEDLRRRQRTETASFTRSLEALIARAKREPAAYAAEWLAKLGLTSAGAADVGATSTEAIIDIPPVDAFELVDEANLGRALTKASPIRGEGLPRFLVLDAAVRGRELVLGFGPRARDVIETWLACFSPLAMVARVSDPSILGFDDLLPTGPRGQAAPLAAAIARSNAVPDRAVVALLDDIDVAAGGFWLPQAARAVRRPADHGLPANLFLIGLVEGDPSSFGFTLERAGELFPLNFDDVNVVGGDQARDLPSEIPLALFAPPLMMNGVADRVEAVTASAANTFNDDDAWRIGVEFRAYLDWAKMGGELPDESMIIAQALTTAMSRIRKGAD